MEGSRAQDVSPVIVDFESMIRGEFVRLESPLVILATLGLLGGCQRALPPLVEGATSNQGVLYDCEQDVVPESNPEFAQSPEIDQRLSKNFPPGTQSERLRVSLVRQGFELHGRCSSDRSISWARFRRGGDRVARVYWREDKNGRLIWTFGAVEFGLTRAIAIKPKDHRGFREFDRIVRVLRDWTTT